MRNPTQNDFMRKYKYIWVPAIIGIYFLFMTFYFGLDLLRSGQALRFWITAGSECLILIALFFFMKKREQLRREREEDISRNSRDKQQ